MIIYNEVKVTKSMKDDRRNKKKRALKINTY